LFNFIINQKKDTDVSYPDYYTL
jgi:hypothetical protein